MGSYETNGDYYDARSDNHQKHELSENVQPIINSSNKPLLELFVKVYFFSNLFKKKFFIFFIFRHLILIIVE